MKVLKFGGTSVGSAASIQNVKRIIANQDGSRFIVLSAMSGVTNFLVEIGENFRIGNSEVISGTMEDLKQKHFDLTDELFTSKIENSSIKSHISALFQGISNLTEQDYSENMIPQILTFGETLMSYIFSEFLKVSGMNNTLLDAKRFMHISNLENPDTEKVGRLLAPMLQNTEGHDSIYITQGFVRIDKFNRINTLKRGGSDFTATIVGAAIDAEEVQIWTDIDGFHNNDPRYVENTHRLSHLTFEEAAELAYFGAKILHPQTVSPVLNRDIPIVLKNTFTPEAPGTKISSDITNRGLKAISAKDGITAIKIKSNRMLMAHGFLKKIFEVFDKHETAIDMITTSEIAISLSIDDTGNLEPILAELASYGEITVEMDHSIICVVGEGLIEDKETYKLFEILNEIPVRMISYGGSINNVSLLVSTKNKIPALQALHKNLFEAREHFLQI